MKETGRERQYGKAIQMNVKIKRERGAVKEERESTIERRKGGMKRTAERSV